MIQPASAKSQRWQCEAVAGTNQSYTPEGATDIFANPLERDIKASVNDGDMSLDIVLDTKTMEGERNNGIKYIPVLFNPRLGVVMLMNTHNDVRRVISLYWKTNVFSYVEMQPSISAITPQMRSAMGDCIVTDL